MQQCQQQDNNENKTHWNYRVIDNLMPIAI